MVASSPTVRLNQSRPQSRPGSHIHSWFFLILSQFDSLHAFNSLWCNTSSAAPGASFSLQNLFRFTFIEKVPAKRYLVFQFKCMKDETLKQPVCNQSSSQSINQSINQWIKDVWFMMWFVIHHDVICAFEFAESASFSLNHLDGVSTLWLLIFDPQLFPRPRPSWHQSVRLTQLFQSKCLWTSRMLSMFFSSLWLWLIWQLRLADLTSRLEIEMTNTYRECASTLIEARMTSSWHHFRGSLALGDGNSLIEWHSLASTTIYL